jgi:predicted ArsR family transcriptional regulator
VSPDVIDMIIIISMSEVRVPHVLAAESRAALLAALQGAGHAVSVTEAAEMLGLHPSTARFHLDLLVSAGLVDRRAERRATAGRPRIRYAARTGAVGVGPGAEPPASPAGDASLVREDEYRRLASVLASQLSDLDDPARAAREAGRRWVEAAGITSEAIGVVPDGGMGTLAADEAVTAVGGLMDRLGFVPDLPVVGDRILLRRCPFEAVAREHRAVVCGVHAGMLEQTFERLGGAVKVAELEPFAVDDPLLCVVRLRRMDEPPPPAPLSSPGASASPADRQGSDNTATAATLRRPPRAAPRGMRDG